MTLLTVRLPAEDDPEAFFAAAARLLEKRASPAAVKFVVGEDVPDLLAARPFEPGGAASSIPAALREEIECLLLHRSSERHPLAYRLLWRQRDEPRLLANLADKDVSRARALTQAVRRDLHKMKAFVRFRETASEVGGTRFVAWFEPAHHLVRRIAPFFAGRFTGMHWSILTPDVSAHWDGTRLSFSAGARRQDAPDGDPLEDVWRSYYASTFNPARLKPKAMMGNMPKKYWHNLPEAQLIAPLIRSAGAREQGMIEAEPTVPRRAHTVAKPGNGGCGGNADTLDTCTRCDLYKHATQAVPGEGPGDARLMLVGEQPGDQEDIAGRPFVGPAGKVLDAGLQRLAIDRSRCFVTNAVKHFKFEPRGKARLHKSPSTYEIDRCRWWLDIERATVKPQVVVALGVTAIRGLTGKTLTLSSMRGEPATLDDGSTLIATVHPSFLLRLKDEQQKREEWRRFLADLEVAKGLIEAA